jgi:hypothetical protein
MGVVFWTAQPPNYTVVLDAGFVFLRSNEIIDLARLNLVR